MKKTSKGIVRTTIYVNDLKVVGDSDVDICDAKLHLKKLVKDLGELQYFMGIEVIKSLVEIWLL